MKLYPAIDLMDGKVVRLKKGDFNAVTVYGEDPIEIAKRYRDAGAEALHLVDLDGAKARAVTQAALLEQIVAAFGLEVQMGGGVRTLEQVQAYLNAGASRVVIGSLAARDPLTTFELLSRIDPAKITLAVDFGKDQKVAVDGWTASLDLTVNELLATYYKKGIRFGLCTDVTRDGMMMGPDVDFYRHLQTDFQEMEIQVSGGIGSLSDLTSLKEAGARAVILGKALYERKFTLQEALKC